LNFERDILIDTKKFQLSFIEIGILNFHIKPYQDLTIADVDEYFDKAEKILPLKKYPILLTFGFGASIDHNVREFAAKSKRRFSLADGLLIENIAHRLLAYFYIKFHKPLIPTSIFNNLDDALVWLRKFVK
jgi:hypothetical protein